MNKNELIDGALLRLRHNVQFQQISSSSKEYKDIEREFRSALNKALSAHTWSFAKKSTDLQEINDELGGYSVPDDCVAILGVGKDSTSLDKVFFEENGRLYIKGDPIYIMNDDDNPTLWTNVCGSCGGCSCSKSGTKCSNSNCPKYVCKPRGCCNLYYISNSVMYRSSIYKQSSYFHTAVSNLLTYHLYDYYYSETQKNNFLMAYERDLAKAIAFDNKHSRGDYKSAIKVHRTAPVMGTGAFGGGFYGGGFWGGGSYGGNW